MKTIAITGSPGTGKTTLAKKLQNQGYILINVPKLIKNYKLSEGYDKKRKCDIVDINKLNKVITTSIKRIKQLTKDPSKNKKSSIKIKIKNIKGIIIDSHLSHHLPKNLIDLCIVAKCSLKTLKKRLEKKHYPKSKIRENLDAEIFDICLTEAKEQGHKVKVVDTTRGIERPSI